MDRCKYIVVEVNGFEIPIVFPSMIEHAEMAHKFRGEVVSAGFVDFQGTVSCYGESLSLDKKAAPGDSILVKSFMHVKKMDMPESEDTRQFRQKLEAIEGQVSRLQAENEELKKGSSNTLY